MKEELFQDMLEGVKQGGEYLKGKRKPSRVFHYTAPDVKAIREGHNLSQEKFASLLGISKGTLRNWEQGRRQPEGPAQRLLQIAAYDLNVVRKAVHGERDARPTRKKKAALSR